MATDKNECHTGDGFSYCLTIVKASVLTKRVVASYEWFEHSDAVRVLRLAHYDHLRVQSEQNCSFHYTQSYSLQQKKTIVYKETNSLRKSEKFTKL